MPRQNLIEQNVFRRLRRLLADLDDDAKESVMAKHYADRLREALGRFSTEEPAR